MALRTITAPGVEIKEIDKSAYSQAMVGTAVYLKGFSSKGEAYKPMEFTSRAAFEQTFGTPDTEAERYFYAAACEAMNQGARLYAARLPYDNAAFEKLVGVKYQLSATSELPEGFSDIATVDPTIQQSYVIDGGKKPALYDLSSVDAFYNGEQKVPNGSFVIIDKTGATYNRVAEDSRKGVNREVIGIVPLVTTAANALYAQNYLSVPVNKISCYEVISGNALATLDAVDLSTGQTIVIDGQTMSNGGLLQSDSSKLFNTDSYFSFVREVDSTCLCVIALSDSNDQWQFTELTAAQKFALDAAISNVLPSDVYSISSYTISVNDYALSAVHHTVEVTGYIVSASMDYEGQDQQFINATSGMVNSLNAWLGENPYICETDAEEGGENAARIWVNSQIFYHPELSAISAEMLERLHYSVEDVTQNVETNVLCSFNEEDERTAVEEDWESKPEEYTGISAYEGELGKPVDVYSVVSSWTASCKSEIPEDDPRYGWHGKDFDDNVPDTLALDAAQFFSVIHASPEEGKALDTEHLKDIGVVVYRAYLDVANGNLVSFEPVEAYCGSLCKDDKDPNTGVSKFIDDIINTQSKYIHFFSNCFNAANDKRFYHDECDILLAPPSQCATLGLYTPMTKKDISISKSILDGMNKAFDKVKNINNLDIDIVPDAGISNIASYLKAIFGDKGPYDLNITDDLGNSLLGRWTCKSANDNSVKIWKSVVLKHDEFCKNIRKDCMFIADAPRPLVLQGQKKIVRDTCPSNSIDKDIIPFIPAICGINTNYGAGYANWFQIADDYSGDLFWCPPSIKAMGAYVNTDINYEYWLAPAGMTRGLISALDVSFNPTGKQAGCFYEKNWNYAINYLQDGIVLEGQKTFQTKPTALDRVNVRRMLLRLEREVYKVVKYFKYENNTAYTRQRLVDAINPILKACYQAGNGGLKRYKILCDESNNTPEVIDRNEMRVQIGVVPNKTAEFILVDFIVGGQNSTWEELF